MTDHYKTLGVSSEASEQEIKKAYRKLSLETHPDRNPNPEATERFKSINEAYETLGDNQKRKQYDMQQSGDPFAFAGGGFPGGFPFGPGGGIRVHHGGGMDPDINNIFNSFFGGAMGGGMNGPHIRVFHNGRPVNMKPKKPEPLIKTIPIKLEQSFSGLSVNLEMEQKNGPKETINVTIQAGVRQGECIVLSERGNMNSEGLKGDVHLIIDIEPHDYFRREGLDLHCKKTISLKEALCGFLVEIPHLNGKMLRMTNQNQGNVVTPGFKREVPGYGMKRDNETGKLILEFGVEFPDSLTDEQRDKLREVL